MGNVRDPAVLKFAQEKFAEGQYVTTRVAEMISAEFGLGKTQAREACRAALDELAEADELIRRRRFELLDSQFSKQIERILESPIPNYSAINTILSLRLKLYGFDKNEVKIIQNSVSSMTPEQMNARISELLEKAKKPA